MNLNLRKKERKSLRGVFHKYIKKNNKNEMKVIKEMVIKKYKRSLND